MSTVAEQLHRAREAKQLSVEQVAEITKIRGDHLRALEEGNFNVFSAPVYIRGFVRTYATLLKLDLGQIMAALDDELGQTEKFREPPSALFRAWGIAACSLSARGSITVSRGTRGSRCQTQRSDKMKKPGLRLIERGAGRRFKLCKG